LRKDDVTAELPGVPRRRGRPPTGKAKTPAQRQAARRARLEAEGVEVVTFEVDKEVADALRALVQFKEETVSQAAERILRAYLLRKR
jgi:hypothetical protein